MQQEYDQCDIQPIPKRLIRGFLHDTGDGFTIPTGSSIQVIFGETHKKKQVHWFYSDCRQELLCPGFVKRKPHTTYKPHLQSSTNRGELSTVNLDMPQSLKHKTHVCVKILLHPVCEQNPFDTPGSRRESRRSHEPRWVVLIEL